MSIQIDKEHCTGCNYCAITCPAGAIHLLIETAAQPVIDLDTCTECGECLYVCPNNVFSAPELEAIPLELKEHYDAIIIGAGIGGLMTAAGLARAGKNVLVLEQMSFVGGKYTHLMHQGYAISTAAWTCPGPNSRIGKLCKKIGADIDWVTVHETGAEGGQQGNHWVVVKDGPRFSSLDEAQETIMGGPGEMHKVHRWVSDMYNPLVSYPENMTAREYIRAFVPDNEEYEKYVQTIITYCFASQTVDTFSAMETKRAIVDSIEQMADWGTAKGGTAAIVAAVERVVKDHNGEIVLRTKVKTINIEHGKVTGVVLENGKKIDADIVIHNAGLNRLISLTGSEKLPDAYISRLRSAIPANVAALVLCTSEPLLGKDHSLLHTMGWDPTLNCYAPTYFDPMLAPEGQHALDVFWVMEPPYNMKSELEKVLQQLREIFPDFDQKVEIKIPMFFTGRWTAEMAHRIGQSGTERLNPQTPIQNLYMVGYDCIGYGMAGDIIPHGVERALYLILDDPAYVPEDVKFSARVNKWLKAQALKLIAVGSRFKK
ncbi:MAG: FAD-dependent oxidoreductase [Anaerolineaceae bacterium]|nr:FAD-dependent oxidoreductase [Anaerolineaceae bacterium]